MEVIYGQFEPIGRNERAQLFSEIGDYFASSVLKEVKSVRRNGKKVGFRGLREKVGTSLKGPTPKNPEKDDQTMRLMTVGCDAPYQGCERQGQLDQKVNDECDVSSRTAVGAKAGISGESSRGSEKRLRGSKRQSKIKENAAEKRTKKKKVTVLSKRLMKKWLKKIRGKSKLTARTKAVTSEPLLDIPRARGDESPKFDRSWEGDFANEEIMGESHATVCSASDDNYDVLLSTEDEREWNSIQTGTTAYGDPGNGQGETLLSPPENESVGPADSKRNVTFYERHHKRIQLLLPKYLPGSPKSFQDFLFQAFLIPDGTSAKRSEIHKRSGGTVNRSDATRRAFIAAAFPPVKVGSIAGKEVAHTFPGDIFPQFSQYEKSRYQCEVCVPYQKWTKQEGTRHSLLKSKSVNVDNIMDGTAVLSFSGVVQAKEHYESRVHKEALKFFQRNDMSVGTKKDTSQPPRKEKVIEDFFKPKVTLN